MKPEIVFGKDALLQPDAGLQTVQFDPRLTANDVEPGGGGGFINLLLKLLKILGKH